MTPFTINKEELDALHETLKGKMMKINPADGEYLDSELEAGSYASGYMQALIDVYKLLK